MERLLMGDIEDSALRDQSQTMLRSDTNVTIMVVTANTLRKMTCTWSSAMSVNVLLICGLYFSFVKVIMEALLSSWMYPLLTEFINCSQNQISLQFYLPWVLAASWAHIQITFLFSWFLIVEYYFKCLLNTGGYIHTPKGSNSTLSVW